jgi:hypothetical protein
LPAPERLRARNRHEWSHVLTFAATRLLGARLGGAVMVAAVATVTVHGEHVRVTPPIVVLLLLAVVAMTAL